MDKLQLPLQSVTMSAEQYEELCEKHKTYENIIKNCEDLIFKISQNGIIIYGFENCLIKGIENVHVKNDMMSGKIEIHIR